MKTQSQGLRSSNSKGGDSVNNEQGCISDSQNGKSWSTPATGVGWGHGQYHRAGWAGTEMGQKVRKTGSHSALESRGLRR